MTMGRCKRLRLLAGLAAFVLSVGPVAAASDTDSEAVERGREIFRQICSACHDLDAVRVGPPLRGVYGRMAGTVSGYRYSADLRNLGLPWTHDTLDIFLTSPRAVLPGTRMGFEGLSDPNRREDAIAFLKSMSPDP